MRRLSLCLGVAALATLVCVAAAGAAGGPLFTVYGGTGVATHDGAFHWVTIAEGARATLRSTSLTRHALRDISSSASSLSSIRRGGLIRAGVAQDPKTPLLVGHVDVAARVDEHVLRLGHKVAG